MKKTLSKLQPIKILPWGEEIYLEIPVFKYRNQMYARYGKNSNEREFIEFSKFGPLPNGVSREISGKTVKSYSQKLRIYKPSHWGRIKYIMESTLFPAIGWKISNAQADVELSVIQQLTKQVRNQSDELKEKKRAVAELMKNISAYRDQNLKNRVPEFKDKLKEFRQLISEEKTEPAYQKFLKNNFWVFGLEYVSAKSQKMAGASNKPDFSLERYDKYRDIVEIKRPQDKVFVKFRKSRFNQGPKLKEALAEVMDYVDYFLTHINDEMVEYGETYYKPRAIIIIGRRESFEKYIKQLNSFLHRIEIVTYDDLLDRAEKIIEFYEK